MFRASAGAAAKAVASTVATAAAAKAVAFAVATAAVAAAPALAGTVTVIEHVEVIEIVEVVEVPAWWPTWWAETVLPLVPEPVASVAAGALGLS